MFQLGLIEVMQADREREIAAAVRLRRLLRPQDGATEPVPAQSARSRRLTVRARPTGV